MRPRIGEGRGRRSSRVWLAEEEHEAAEKAREGAKGGAAAQPGRNCGVMASLASRLNAIARSWPVLLPAWLPLGLVRRPSSFGSGRTFSCLGHVTDIPQAVGPSEDEKNIISPRPAGSTFPRYSNKACLH
jgi:hypothetical protein